MTGARRQQSWWLRWYPSEWRDRYGEEIAAYLEDTYGAGALPWRARTSLVVGGLRERGARSFASSTPELALRSGIATVLLAWAMFVVAGSVFAKFAEHFGDFLPGGIHDPALRGIDRVPSTAWNVLQATSGVAVLVGVLGAALGLGAVASHLRRRGFGRLRGKVVLAMALVLTEALCTVALAEWAHRLTNAQRNGGSVAYTAAVVVWGALGVCALAAVVAIGLTIVRTVPFAGRLLRFEALLAVAVSASMAVMTVACVAWWITMARSSTGFFGGAHASPVDPELVLVVLVMVLASVLGAYGVVLVWRGRPLHTAIASH